MHGSSWVSNLSSRLGSVQGDPENRHSGNCQDARSVSLMASPVRVATRRSSVSGVWESGRQLLPYRITEGLLVIRPLPREHPATTRPLPNVYNISGFHSSTEVDDSDVERYLGNDRPKPSNLRNLCGAAIPAAQFHPSSRA